MDLHVSEPDRCVVQIPGCDAGSEIFLGIFSLFKQGYAPVSYLVQKILHPHVVEFGVVLPRRDLQPEHFYRAAADRDRWIFVNPAHMPMDLMDVFLQNIYQTVPLLFHDGNVHLQLFNQAVIGCDRGVKLFQRQGNLACQLQHGFQGLPVKIVLELVSADHPV